MSQSADLFGALPPVEPVAATLAADHDTNMIARAMALLWTHAPRTNVYQLLRALGWRDKKGRGYTQETVRAGIGALRSQGQLVEHPARDGYLRLADGVRARLYEELLSSDGLGLLRSALYACLGYRPEQRSFGWPLYDSAATLAVLRMAVYSGTPLPDLKRMAEQISHVLDWYEVTDAALLAAFSPASFERVPAPWRDELASGAISRMCAYWSPEHLPVCEWALQGLESNPQALAPHLRMALAELLLHRGQAQAAARCLQGLEGGAVDALHAVALVQAGDWAAGQHAFEAALKRRSDELRARKRVLPTSVAWLYPLCLVAQRSPAHLAKAHKFCLGEAGKRDPHAHSSWGAWVNAIGSRLGSCALDKDAFLPADDDGAGEHLDELWRLLLAAWLGRDALGGQRNLPARIAQRANALRENLKRIGFAWTLAQVDAAADLLLYGKETPGFFAGRAAEKWRDLLGALRALDSEKPAREAETPAGRVVWLISRDKQGRLAAIDPVEQTHGARGWSKPKRLGLAKIADNEALAPWDAKVARALRKGHRGTRDLSLDLAAAIVALVGHPAVAFAESPEQFIDVVEASPEIEVLRDRDGYVLRVTPEPPEQVDDDRYFFSTEARKEAEALRAIHLIQDSPQRLRLVRLNAPQRRAAQLLAQKLVVPAAAEEELQATLRALAGHFDVHADHTQGGVETLAESRLRAELAPAGEGLHLRMVAAPLGADGPRLIPASGRARVSATVCGAVLATRRDLAAERSNLEAVLDALPFLDEPSGAPEWRIDDPEQALSVVETLPTIAAMAGVDWPKGRKLRVIPVEAAQVAVKVVTARDWFRIDARANLDEGLVLELDALLAAASANGRFVPMGEGVYIALTKQLKAKLAELAAVVESDRDGVRVPRAAAAWLDELLDGVPAEADRHFSTAIERLRCAHAAPVPMPGALQAQMRPYQEDGYGWAMRLAAAGFGGVLADDMGLGKTVQAMAVLAARGADGPALVVAPTSVCGNWLAEAGKFVPGLAWTLYGEGGREELVADAGPMSVVVVSYTLLQQSAERFASRKWHTVIVDEAQAIKNAAAKRSQAVFDLDAEFRLALSGTPVENRLAELWSIMRFANPGLLGSANRFNQRFAAAIERSRDREAQQLLRRLIAPFVLRRTKSQVLQELPARTELALMIEPDRAEAAHYEALRRRAIAEVEQAVVHEDAAEARFNILAQLTRLRRAACDPRLITPEFAPGAKVQAFAALAQELVANGHKALVFSQFVDFLALLRQSLDALSISHQYLDGATLAAERTRRVAAFQAGHGDLFLISLKAGGYGLNLTAADYVVITDPWWNPAAEDQAMGRAHRIGQNRPVTVYRLVAKGSIEERIVEVHHDKRALAEGLLADGDVTVLPSTAELMALMRGGMAGDHG